MSKKNEKIDAKELAKKLLNDRTHGAAKVGAKELEKAGEFAEGYKSFMDAAKTEREAVTWAVRGRRGGRLCPLRPGQDSLQGRGQGLLQQPGQGHVPGRHRHAGRHCDGRAHRRCPHRLAPAST